jgi:serine/threonine-protein kinase RsbW
MRATTLYAGTFPGTPDQVGRVRRELRAYLTTSLAADDVVLITSELATNAILHSHSNGRSFTVRAEAAPGYVWLEVEDLGGPWLPAQQDGRPHGLEVVAALAGDWGVRTTPGGRIVWARVDIEGGR